MCKWKSFDFFSFFLSARHRFNSHGLDVIVNCIWSSIAICATWMKWKEEEKKYVRKKRRRRWRSLSSSSSSSKINRYNYFKRNYYYSVQRIWWNMKCILFFFFLFPLLHEHEIHFAIWTTTTTTTIQYSPAESIEDRHSHQHHTAHHTSLSPAPSRPSLSPLTFSRLLSQFLSPLSPPHHPSISALALFLPLGPFRSLIQLQITWIDDYANGLEAITNIMALGSSFFPYSLSTMD